MDHLQADSIIKSYGSLRVLSDIYITCESGEVVGLVGRNGCGKSTLLKIIHGSLHAEQKYIKANNKHISVLADSIKHVKYLPQDSYLPKNIRLKTLLRLFGNAVDMDKLETNPLIKGFLNYKPVQLSGGERRLIEILLILYSKADYLLLDEPFNGVAPIYKETIKELIREKATKKGIIITDHDYRNVLDISDRIVLIQDGRIVNIKDRKDLEKWGYLPTSP